MHLKSLSLIAPLPITTLSPTKVQPALLEIEDHYGVALPPVTTHRQAGKP